MKRPNIFGNQNYRPSNSANSGAIAMTRWKCATTKYVSWSWISAADVPRKIPLNPPLTNIDTKPKANSPAAVKRIRAPQTVPNQLNVFTAEGTAISSVVSVNTEPRKGFIPLTNIWWPHTTKLRTAMATIEYTIMR